MRSFLVGALLLTLLCTALPLAAAPGDVSTAWTTLLAATAARDPAVLAAAAELAAAQTLPAQARVTLNPALEIELEEIQPWESSEVALRLGYRLEREASGKIDARLALAEASVRQAELALAAAQGEAVHTALEQGIALRESQQILASQEQVIAGLRQTLAVLGERYAAGELAGGELARLTAAAALEESGRDLALLEAAQAQAQLTSTLGPEITNLLTTESPIPLLPEWTLAQWQELAHQYNPVLQTRALELRIAALELAAAQVASRSDLAWMASVEWSGDSPIFGVGIELPLKQRGNGTLALQTAWERRRHGAETALAAESLVLDAAIAQALATLQATTAARIALDQALGDSPGRSVQAAESAYLEGESTIAEYLDARRQHQEVAARQLELAAAQERAMLQLLHTAGLLAHPEVLR